MSSRWFARLLERGQDPDPRFTLANERTFLAWTRTALALIAGGVGLEAFAGDAVPRVARTVLAVLLIVLGASLAIGALTRWFATERALRERRSLPSPTMSILLVAGLIVVCVVLAVALLIGSDGR
jgi:putative membrane protein